MNNNDFVWSSDILSLSATASKPQSLNKSQHYLVFRYYCYDIDRSFANNLFYRLLFCRTVHQICYRDYFNSDVYNTDDVYLAFRNKQTYGTDRR